MHTGFTFENVKREIGDVFVFPFKAACVSFEDESECYFLAMEDECNEAKEANFIIEDDKGDAVEIYAPETALGLHGKKRPIEGIEIILKPEYEDGQYFAGDFARLSRRVLEDVRRLAYLSDDEKNIFARAVKQVRPEIADFVEYFKKEH